MRFLCLQHHPIEGPGAIRDWMSQNGHQLTVRLSSDTSLADLSVDWDGLILMGGPMSVHDASIHPWLAEEIHWVGQWLRQGKRTLGICLGAQIMAHLLGGKVTPMANKEIGWYPVQGEGWGFPAEEFVAYHWHGETFSIPPGATCMVSNGHCPQQGFALGSGVIGLQFHLEAGYPEVRKMLETFAGEIVEGAPGIQSADTQLAAAEVHAAGARAVLDGVLRGWVS